MTAGLHYFATSSKGQQVLFASVFMPAIQFDRDAMARWYAQQHLKTDPGIRSVYYLPTNAPEREIRLIEINELLADRYDDALEPVDFGVDNGMESAHQLFVLDVTPGQWDKIRKLLPHGWSLDAAQSFTQSRNE